MAEIAEARRQGLRAAAVGLVLAAGTVVFILLLPSKQDGVQVLAVLLGMIAGAYLGFAVADGRSSALILESLGIAGFVSIAALGLWFDQPLLLAAGYAAHGGWDVLHPHGLRTEVKPWYPPFCLTYDMAVAAFLVGWA